MKRIRSIMLAAITVVCTMVMAQKSIKQQIYWIDYDISAAQKVTSAVDVSNLPSGIHAFSVRVEDSKGLWSSPVTKYFYIPYVADEKATSIVDREYWIDSKFASRASLDKSPTAIMLDGLTAGLHSLTVRVKNDVGLWSSLVTKYFYIPYVADEKATSIVEREYWIDAKPATRATLDKESAVIMLDDLTEGIHSLTIRVKNDVGLWSTPVTQYFIVPRPSDIEVATIARYMYWIDDDTENIVSRSVDTPSGIVPIDIGELEEGEHTLSWRVADSKGKWSDLQTGTFTFIKTAITTSMIALSNNTFVYNAEDIEPEVTVMDGDVKLVKDDDYTVSYANNHNAGSATVTVTGKGAYKETADIPFTIERAFATISFDEGRPNKVYGDEAFTNILTNSGDGIVSYASSNENVATVNAETGEVAIVGTGSVTITATVNELAEGNYKYAEKSVLYTLSVTADKSALDAIISEANTYKESIAKDYADIVEKLDEIIKAARQVKDNVYASQAEVDTAQYTLANTLQQIKEEVATGIITVCGNADHNAWFTFDGKKINGEPTVKGIYVKDGRKVVVK
jgi:hypothetical protein